MCGHSVQKQTHKFGKLRSLCMSLFLQTNLGSSTSLFFDGRHASVCNELPGICDVLQLQIIISRYVHIPELLGCAFHSLINKQILYTFRFLVLAEILSGQMWKSWQLVYEFSQISWLFLLRVHFLCLSTTIWVFVVWLQLVGYWPPPKARR